MNGSGAWPWIRSVRFWVRARRREWSRILDARISIIPLALGVLILSFPQGLDVVRDLVDSSNLYLRDPNGGILSLPALASYFRWACFWASCLWSGVNAWYWPHLLTLSRTAAPEPDWFRVLRRILGTAPTLAALVAILVAGNGHIRDVWIAILLFGGTTLLLPILLIYRRYLVGRYLADSWWRRRSAIMEPLLLRFGGRHNPELTLGDDAFVLSTFLLSLLVLALFSIPVVRTEFAVHVGSASIAFGAAGSMIATISALIWLLSGTRLPVVAVGAIAIVLFGTTNDTHAIHAVQSDLVMTRPSIRQAYERWAGSNPDGPLILVATAGGASRASYWTSQVFRALDDRTGGTFGRQVFAISAVSGGTLGAFSYAAWQKDHPASPACPYSPVARRAFDQRFLGGDYLSPALGGLLYPDLVQQFLFFPAFADRARALEESWERGWASAVTRDQACRGGGSNERFAADYLEIWRSSLFGSGPWVPIVLANGTLVEDGKRVITAPVQVDPLIFEDSHDFVTLFGSSVGTSTAVLNSARFPLVSPAGTLPVEGGAYHIVDGGYFENGGLETLYDLARYLRTIVPAARQILIIEINNDDATPGDPHSVDDLARYPNGMDPAAASRITLGVATPVARHATPAEGIRAVIGAFYQTRSSRGVLGAKRLSSLRAIGLNNVYRATFNLGPLLKGRQTAMSWSLSLSSRQAMDDALQAVGPWLPEEERHRVLADQSSLGDDIGCERVAADEIAAAIGAVVAPGAVNCALSTNHARWVGVPIGLAPAHRVQP